MPPLTLTIAGDYWDSHLYQGNLILFDMEGMQRVIDWRALVSWLADKFEPPTGDLVSSTLTAGAWGYAKGTRALLHDPLVRERLSVLMRFEPLEVSKQELQRFELSRGESGLPYAFSDSVCYEGALYAVAQEGVFAKELRRERSRRAESPTPAMKLWDAPVSGVDAYARQIGLAAGNEGLVVSKLSPKHSLESTKLDGLVAWKSLCNDCDFAGDGILGYTQGLEAAFVSLPSGLNKRGFIVEGATEVQGQPVAMRAEEVFGRSLQGAVVWGSRHQLCFAKDSTLLLARLPAKSARLIESKPQISSVELQPIKGGPVSGGTAVFGAILETDNCVVVAQSDGKFHNIWGEATSWRMFPRSDYCNQLHVVLDAHLEITAFVHDWFLDQATKKVGEPFAPFRSRSSGSQ